MNRASTTAPGMEDDEEEEGVACVLIVTSLCVKFRLAPQRPTGYPMSVYGNDMTDLCFLQQDDKR
jgi:hypothetical protein